MISNEKIVFLLIQLGLFGPNAHERIQVQTPPTNDTLLRVRYFFTNFSPFNFIFIKKN